MINETLDLISFERSNNDLEFFTVTSAWFEAGMQLQSSEWLRDFNKCTGNGIASRIWFQALWGSKVKLPKPRFSRSQAKAKLPNLRIQAIESKDQVTESEGWVIDFVIIRAWTWIFLIPRRNKHEIKHKNTQNQENTTKFEIIFFISRIAYFSGFLYAWAHAISLFIVD